jgi:N-acyl-D-amino-acid deacylase
MIYDGSGTVPYEGFVGISNDKISAIGRSTDWPEATNTVDAQGLYLTPGFIDTHASTGFGFFFPHAADHKLYQGITTEIFGNCGTSPAPIGPNLRSTMERLAGDLGFDFNWTSLAEYYDRLESIGLQFNIATLTGHSTLRGGILSDWHTVSAAELESMRDLMRASMLDGSLGLSTGLIYAPGCFAGTNEIIDLAKVATEYGGVYASHMRDERDELEQAVEETLEIGEKAGINVLISHLKAAEKQNYGKLKTVLKRLEEYNRSHDVQAKIDIYPYTAVSTKVRAFIPKKLLEHGIENLPQQLATIDAVDMIADHIIEKDYDLRQMMIISNEFPDWEGKTVQQIADVANWSQARTLVEILTKNPEMWMVYHCIDEADIDYAITWPDAMICTDSWSHPINAPKNIGVPHPRSYGAFTQFIQDYVKKKKMLSFEEAVRKMTKMPARYFNIEGRGEILEGNYADLVLFDFKQIKARATYTNPCVLSSGVQHLWVNGQPVIEDGEINESQSGVIITSNAK